MLLQTNSYIVPKERRAEHARLIRRFRQALAQIGCDQFDVYEQVGANWNASGANGRYVQLMRFRDRQHQLDVQAAERDDAGAQAIIAEFCALINFPYQQQHGYFATGFYTSVTPMGPRLADEATPAAGEAYDSAAEVSSAGFAGASPGTSDGTSPGELPVVDTELPADLPEPDMAEHAALASGPVEFGEVAIADAVDQGPDPLEMIGLSEHPDVVESSQDLTPADELALADEPAARPHDLTPQGHADPAVIESLTEWGGHDSTPEINAGPISADPADESDLLDLSAIELTDEEVESEQGDLVMLDALLPEEDAYGALLDDTNIRDHVPPPENGRQAPAAHDEHGGADTNESQEPVDSDAELLEFDAFLRQFKEGPAEPGHR